MFKKIIEFNQATLFWWEKQQGKLTKTQHDFTLFGMRIFRSI